MYKSGYGVIVAAWLATATMGLAQEKAELPALRILPQTEAQRQLPPTTDLIPVEPRVHEGQDQEMAPSCPGKSCWQGFCDWLCYHPAPAPHHCGSYVPVPRHPPLYQYFLHRAVSRNVHCQGR